MQISIYNRHVPEKEEDIAIKIVNENPAFKSIQGFDDLEKFTKSLERPRKILLMIMAGTPVDSQIESLIPLLDAGDVIIDGGNSLYKDTSRRSKYLAEKGIHFFGAGISGGEEGARKGPSIMPGGSKEGYKLVEKYLQLLAAKDKDGNPCTTYVGPEGSGHFIKMVHNGIEYAEMQALAEAYYLLRYYGGYEADKVAETFSAWKNEGCDSYLLEITIDILRKKENGELLLDKILDQAEQKGTGGWSAAIALEYGVPYSPLSEAVMARALSSMKPQRNKASELYRHSVIIKNDLADGFVTSLKNALQAVRIINHEIGFNLMAEVSNKLNWGLNFSEIARIWTNGCIIRSQLMEELVQVFKNDSSLLTAPSIVRQMKNYEKDLSTVVAEALKHRFALPVFSASLNYFLGYVTANSPANLIQAQRDYFGAHTYKRVDRADDQYFHTIWKSIDNIS